MTAKPLAKFMTRIDVRAELLLYIITVEWYSSSCVQMLHFDDITLLWALEPQSLNGCYSSMWSWSWTFHNLCFDLHNDSMIWAILVATQTGLVIYDTLSSWLSLKKEVAVGCNEKWIYWHTYQDRQESDAGHCDSKPGTACPKLVRGKWRSKQYYFFIEMYFFYWY